MAGLAAFGVRWRLLESPPADGATNMAIDTALLDAARHGLATLRLYTWSRPTLSLGRHERARGRFSAPRLAAEGVDIVRRPTGGRALLHHREVTYAIAAPVGALSLRERYATINGLLAEALRRLGVAVTVAAPATRTPPPGRSACFAEPSTGELVVGEAKLVASAQAQQDGAFLQHGSILLEDDQWRIAGLVEETAPPTRAASLTAALGRPVGADEVRAALREAFRRMLTGDPVTSPAVLESVPLDGAAVHRHLDRFTDPAWTWVR